MRIRVSDIHGLVESVVVGFEGNRVRAIINCTDKNPICSSRVTKAGSQKFWFDIHGPEPECEDDDDAWTTWGEAFAEVEFFPETDQEKFAMTGDFKTSECYQLTDKDQIDLLWIRRESWVGITSMRNLNGPLEGPNENSS